MSKYIKHNINKIKGKHIGNNLYFHVSQLPYLPKDLRDEISELSLILNHYSYDYNIIKIDKYYGDISLIMSNDFNDNYEPHIDISYRMMNKLPPKVIDYRLRDIDKIPVYHHKWMFVADDYKGFDVQASKERSTWWETHPVVIKHMQEDKYFKSRIGLNGFWNNVLKEIDEYERKAKISC